MSRQVNVNVGNYDGKWSTRIVLDPSLPSENYTLIGADTTVSFTNKDITDPSNKVASTGININGSFSQITGNAVPGNVLTYVGPDLEFRPVSGSASASAIKYVSYQAILPGDGSIGAPFQTIGEAITATSSISEMKTIYVLPGEYNESISIRPNTLLIGQGANIVLGNILSNVAGPLGLSGTYQISGFTGLQVYFEFPSPTDAASISLEGMNLQDVTVLSDSAASVSMNMTGSSCTLFTGTVTSIKVNECQISGSMSVASGDVSIFSSKMDGLNVIGSGTVKIYSSIPGMASFDGPMTVQRDAQSMSQSTYLSGATASIVNDFSLLQIDPGNVLIGTGVNPATLTNSTILGTGANGFASGINKTAVGHGASVISDNQVAFSDAATSLKASGLSGHSAATTLTYNAATGVINYLSSSGIKKDHVKCICPKKSGEMIDGMKPRHYTWKETGEEAPGLIAEELDILSNDFPACNSLIARDKDGNPISVNYILLVPYLISLVQDLRERVSVLENTETKKNTTSSPEVQGDKEKGYHDIFGTYIKL